jgi:hypothetical protein
MEMRPQLMLQAVTKSLIDIVIPAVSPDNKLAQEQSRLILGILQILMTRLPLAYRYDRTELDRLVALAGTLTAEGYDGSLSQEAARQLDAAKATGLDVLDRARAEPAELEDTVRAMRTAVAELIRAVHGDGEGPRAEAVRDIVFKASKEQLDRERAWVVPYGFEADASVVPPLETVLAPVPKRG